MIRPGKNWATPTTSTPWAIAAVVTQWVKQATGYRIGSSIHHFAWERSHGDKSRRHPWQSLRSAA